MHISQSLSNADTGEEGEELENETQSVDEHSLLPSVFDNLGKYCT